MRSLRKVVIRTRDGEVVAGFLKEEPVANPVSIVTRQGDKQKFDLEKLKAVFFVKDFRGNPEYNDIKFLNRQKINPMIWVRVEFFDGEILEGKIQNNLQLLSAPAFFLWPSDPNSNNEGVYVVKSALTDFAILFPV